MPLLVRQLNVDSRAGPLSVLTFCATPAGFLARTLGGTSGSPSGSQPAASAAQPHDAETPQGSATPPAMVSALSGGSAASASAGAGAPQLRERKRRGVCATGAPVLADCSSAETPAATGVLQSHDAKRRRVSATPPMPAPALTEGASTGARAADAEAEVVSAPQRRRLLSGMEVCIHM